MMGVGWPAEGQQPKCSTGTGWAPTCDGQPKRTTTFCQILPPVLATDGTVQ
jgi:hypothetical protein